MANQYRDRPFPADDDYGRDNSRSASQPQVESDPLAELARLIGQTDPFSNFGRNQQQAQPQRYEPAAAAEQAADYDYEEEPVRRPSWVQNLATARQAQAQTPAYHEDDQYEQQRYADDPYGDQRHASSHDHAPYQDHAPHFDHSGYDPLPGQTQQYAAPDDRYDDVLYGRAPHDAARDDQYGAYDDGAYEQPYGEPPEDEAPKARRGGMMTVVAVVLLAVVGTGAAFAYRTFVGSPRSGEPPIIKADAGPNKLIPPGAGDGSGKQITDRLGEKSAERVVTREEQPVDMNARTGPRVVFPPLTQNTNPPTVASASTTTRPTGSGVGNGTLSGGEEPRKIRTLSIRPDQPDASAAAAPATRSQPTRAASPANTASTGTANAPVSLAPQSAPAVAQPKVAAVNPAVGTGGGSGSFVQVSSQKTEADARASFKALQGKYAGILGSRTAAIRKADVAGKGTFYRAMVGPFGSADEATQFCLNLKSAGGQCVVAR